MVHTPLVCEDHFHLSLSIESHTGLQRILRIHLSMIKTVLIYPLSVGNETLSVESSKLFLIFNNPVQGKNKAAMQHLKYKIQSSK